MCVQITRQAALRGKTKGEHTRAPGKGLKSEGGIRQRLAARARMGFPEDWTTAAE